MQTCMNSSFLEEIFMEIKSWEDYFLDLAKTCASRSNCLRAQVGAVIVGEDKKVGQSVRAQ